MQQVINGLQVGSWYAILALAIVLVLKSTAVANFAMAEIGLIPVFVIWTLQDRGVLPYWGAVAVGFVIAALIGLAVERIAIRPLLSKGPYATMIMTFAIFVVANAAIQLGWSPVARHIVSPFEGSFTFAGQLVQYEQLVSIGSGLAIMLALKAFFRSPFGVQVQAISEDRTTARLLGVSASTVSSSAWAIAAVIAAIAMLLQSESTVLSDQNGVSLLIKAFAAAALGGFGSVLGAFLGGLALGVAENLAGAYISPASASVVALLAIVVILSLRPSGIFGGLKVREV